MNVLANELSRKSYRRVGDGIAIASALAVVLEEVAGMVDGAELRFVVGSERAATCAGDNKGGAAARTFGGRFPLAFDDDRVSDFEFAVDFEAARGAE